MKPWDEGEGIAVLTILKFQGDGLSNAQIRKHLVETVPGITQLIAFATIQHASNRADELANHMLTRYLSGVSEADLISEVSSITRLDNDLVEPLVTAFLKTAKEHVEEGVEGGYRRFREGHSRTRSTTSQVKSRRTVPRVICLSLGILFSFGALGNLIEHQFAESAFGLVLGTGLASFFWILRPKHQGQPSVPLPTVSLATQPPPNFPSSNAAHI